MLFRSKMRVEEPYRGLGFGSMLFRHAADKAKTLNAKSMEWVALPDSGDSLERLIGFYSKFGGKIVYNHGDAAMMRLDLSR